MYQEISHLLLYGDLGEDSILVQLAGIIQECKEGGQKDALLRRA